MPLQNREKKRNVRVASPLALGFKSHPQFHGKNPLTLVIITLKRLKLITRMEF